MKTIKIRVPNKSSYGKEWEVLNAISKLINKMEKDLGVDIQYGQGGNLDDWKEPELGGEKGMLMVIKVSLKGKDALDEAFRYYKKSLRQFNNITKLVYKEGQLDGLSLLLAKEYLNITKHLLKQV